MHVSPSCKHAYTQAYIPHINVHGKTVQRLSDYTDTDLFGSQFQRLQFMVFTHVALGPGMGSEWQNKTIHFMDRKGRKKRKRSFEAQPQ